MSFIEKVQSVRQDQKNVTYPDQQPGKSNDWENEPIYEEPIPLLPDFLVQLYTVA